MWPTKAHVRSLKLWLNDSALDQRPWSSRFNPQEKDESLFTLLFIQHPSGKIGAWEQNGNCEEPYFGAPNVKVADSGSPF